MFIASAAMSVRCSLTNPLTFSTHSWCFLSSDKLESSIELTVDLECLLITFLYTPLIVGAYKLDVTDMSWSNLLIKNTINYTSHVTNTSISHFLQVEATHISAKYKNIFQNFVVPLQLVLHRITELLYSSTPRQACM